MKKPRVLATMNTQRENFLTEQKVEQYYFFKNNCNCPELEIFWDLIKKIDGLALKCTEYVEDIINNEKRKTDLIFMNAFQKYCEKWNNETQEYEDSLHRLYSQGHIKIKSFLKKRGNKRTPISLEKAVKRNNIILEMSCGYCDTKLPIPTYEKWSINAQ